MGKKLIVLTILAVTLALASTVFGANLGGTTWAGFTVNDQAVNLIFADCSASFSPCGVDNGSLFGQVVGSEDRFIFLGRYSTVGQTVFLNGEIFSIVDISNTVMVLQNDITQTLVRIK